MTTPPEPEINCVFCRILDGQKRATLVYEWDSVIGIVPLNPVTDGHVIFIPDVHVADFTQEPAISAEVMDAAARYAQSIGDCNLITSKGSIATQTVGHLHLHVVPRREGDGLKLPWSPS